MTLSWNITKRKTMIIYNYKFINFLSNEVFLRIIIKFMSVKMGFLLFRSTTKKKRRKNCTCSHLVRSRQEMRRVDCGWKQADCERLTSRIEPCRLLLMAFELLDENHLYSLLNRSHSDYLSSNKCTAYLQLLTIPTPTPTVHWLTTDRNINSITQMYVAFKESSEFKVYQQS